MSNKVDTTEMIHSTKKKVTDTIKGYVFDLIALALIAAMFAVGLGALEVKELTWKSLLDIFIGFVPFYVAMCVLNSDYYSKGVFKGKSTKIYGDAMAAYSSIAGNLTGEQHDTIYEFCEYYNDMALKQLQTAILKRAAITYEYFINGDENLIRDDGTPIPPIAMTKEELLKYFNKEQTKAIMAAKRVKIHGISANVLLSNIQSIDNTDIGKSEKEMRLSHMTVNNVVGFISIFVLCLISFKDLQEWSWWEAALVLFKMVWVFVRSYLEYFRAYSDITTNLVNHLARKSDILKQFIYWHDKYKTPAVVEQTEVIKEEITQESPEQTVAPESNTQLEIPNGDGLTLAPESNN